MLKEENIAEGNILNYWLVLHSGNSFNNHLAIHTHIYISLCLGMPLGINII